VFQRELLAPAVFIRNIAEILCGFLGILALIYNPLGLHTAVTQAIPLVVTIGAVFYLRERLSPVRLGTTLAGFGGVLLIIQPWSEDFHKPIILSILSVFAVALRDIVTRRLPRTITSYSLLFWSHVTALPLALALFLVLGDHWQKIPLPTLVAYAGATMFGLSGGIALTLAVRLGEASVTTPFRYSRILFAFVLGVMVFGEEITQGMISGSVILVLAGIWLFRAERVRARARMIVPHL
jgi:drug/metabolite transporter (DMT)-like permease